MSIFNKIKWILGVLMIFLIILATNLIDNDNFRKIEGAVESIYDDRLLAKDLVLDISMALHKKELAHALSDSLFFIEENEAVDEEIDYLIASFEETSMTKAEKRTVKNLEKHMAELRKRESDGVNNSLIFEECNSIKVTLNDLADIQLAEGQRQVRLSEKAFDSSELFTRIELYFLLFMGILIQVMILYRPKRDE